MKTILTFFEKLPFIVFNEIIVHLLKLCYFTHEIIITWIWSHLNMLLESFVIQNTCWHNVFKHHSNWTCFHYFNLHQMFSNLLRAIKYFIKRATCAYISCTCIRSFKCIYYDVVDFDFKCFNDYNISKFVITVQKKVIYFIIM